MHDLERSAVGMFLISGRLTVAENASDLTHYACIPVRRGRIQMAVTPNWLEELYVMFRHLRGHKEPTTRPLLDSSLCFMIHVCSVS
jgi:hypothetical protein